MRQRHLVCALVLLAGCAGVNAVQQPPPPPVAEAPPAPPPAPVAPASLYSRIGGVEALRAVVPRFLEHVAADERINYFFALTDLDALKPRLVDFFCSATGGPCKYTGRDMRTAHAALPIGPEHFDALVEDLVKTFDEFHVPAREKAELLAALGPLRGDIVHAR